MKPAIPAASTFTVTLSDTNGVLNATGGTQSNGNHTVTITGSLATVNSDLATLTDTDANAAADTINVSTTDSFGNSATPKAIAVAVGDETHSDAEQHRAPPPCSRARRRQLPRVSLAEGNSAAGETFTVMLSGYQRGTDRDWWDAEQ